MPNCPRCGSSNIHADKKGLSVKKSLAGGLLFGSVGLLCGLVGNNKIRLTCLDCGYEFQPGERNSDVNKIMSHYNSINNVAATPTPTSKKSTEQVVRIETLLKYCNVIKESKVALLEAMLSEGHTYVVVPIGEIDILSKLQKQGSETKRIVSFKEYVDK